MIYTGDCLDVMAGMEPESVDAIVTDPPYGLRFMGKAWDHHVPGVPFWREMLRVAKPSAYLLSFGGTRTVHRIATNIEDAGWIIRDMLVWAYASGFPKSKASLKPAWEPIVMARKPGPLRMLAIDLCRIPMSADDAANIDSKHAGMDVDTYERPVGTSLQLSTDPMPLKAAAAHALGRWPANVILTDPIFDGDTPGVVGGGAQETHAGTYRTRSDGNWFGPERDPGFSVSQGESGTYSRFFLIPKADRADREPVLGGLPRVEREGTNGTNRPMRVCRECGRMKGGAPGNCQCGPTEIDEKPLRARANVHPTVKPTELMRHLVRLVTPTGGLVLDPFLGSGTTAIACELEGFRWIGIEKEPENVAIAEARLNGTQRGLGLSA